MVNLKKNQIRIVNDIINFKNNNFKKIFIYPDIENIFKIYALIIGPEDTPYQNGFYFFELIFPNNYPINPPKVNFCTIDKDVRFNPNLYENGKVCLSILGTWTGPGWTPSMTLTSILLSIQSLLHNNPISNEPGYENIKADNIKSINYNNYLKYFNYKVALYQVLLRPKFSSWRRRFKSEINEFIKTNKISLLSNLNKDFQKLHNKKIDKQIYFMKSTLLNFDFHFELKNKYLKYF